MFVTDMYDLSDNKKGTVYILDEWSATTGKFGKVISYMTGLKNPNSVQFFIPIPMDRTGYILQKRINSPEENLTKVK